MENQTTSALSKTSPDSSLQIANLEVSPEIRQHWKTLPAALFNESRAVLCYGLTIGAWQQVQPMGFDDCFKMGTPTLGGVAFYTGEENALQLVAEMITQASLLLNVGKNLRAEQIYATANMLLRNPDFKIFTVADFRLAISRGVMGKYGTVYDRFDIQIISEWLEKYWVERQERAEQISYEAHMNQKNQPETWSGSCPEWFSAFVAEFVQRNADNRKKEKNEFKPDDAMLRFWRAEWEQMTAPRPPFQSYCKLQAMKIQQ